MGSLTSPNADGDISLGLSENSDDEKDPPYRPSDRELTIREKQALQKERYEQLLDLMNKSDLFVKMIFQRMEESNKLAEKKVQRLRKREVS